MPLARTSVSSEETELRAAILRCVKRTSRQEGVDCACSEMKDLGVALLQEEVGGGAEGPYEGHDTGGDPGLSGGGVKAKSINRVAHILSGFTEGPIAMLQAARADVAPLRQ